VEERRGGVKGAKEKGLKEAEAKEVYFMNT
jgi:hypothetical protein